MSSDGNHTNSTLHHLDMSNIWVFVPTCTMAIAGILANVYLIFTIYRQQSLRRAPTYVVLMCLALVDAIHLVFLTCAGIYYIYVPAKTSPLCQIMIFSMYCMTGVSGYHVVIFSVLRYVILVKPFFAMKYVTVKNTLCSCIMCWLVFSCLAGLAFLTTEAGNIETSDGKQINMCVKTENGKFVEMIICILEYHIPLSLISGFHVAKCVHVNRRSMEAAHTPTVKLQVSTAVVVTIITIYTICYFPMTTYILITLISEIPVTSKVHFLGYCFAALIPANSALNPFVYFFFTKCFNKGKRREAGKNAQTISPQRPNTSPLPRL